MDVTPLLKAEDDLLAIELDTSDKVASILRPVFARILAEITALWPGDDASQDAKTRALASVRLNRLQPLMALVRSTIKQGAREALAHGLRAAQDEALAAGARAMLPPSGYHLSAALHGRVDKLEQDMRESVANSSVLLGHVDTLTDVHIALAVAQQGINKSEMVARYVTNEASNDALTTVSRATDELVSVWHAERDACLDCLAYQGEIDTGEGYPEGLTFADKPISRGPVESPPLHPNCRCSQWLVHKDVAEPLAESLKREAERSVLRGWSLPSESNNARVAAANRLLNRGTDLPKSVREYAQRAVKHGTFMRGRRPPT